MKQKCLYLMKNFIDDKNLTAEAICVMAALRNIMIQDENEYYISYGNIAYNMFLRNPDRNELESIKKGFNLLVKRNIVVIKYSISKTEFCCDLSSLYYNKTSSSYFLNVMNTELLSIMTLKDNIDKYKLFRYFVGLVSTFNHSSRIQTKYRGKFSKFAISALSSTTHISTRTLVNYNMILEKNNLLYIIRNKDYCRRNYIKREETNIYCRYTDKDLVFDYCSSANNYKYNINNHGYKTVEANSKRALGQKYRAYCNGKKYDQETLQQLYEYCNSWNEVKRQTYEEELHKGYSPAEPKYKDVVRLLGDLKEL